MKFYKRDPDAALAGMAELTLQERGAYNSIIDLLYSRDGVLPDDDETIRRLVGCHGNEWRAVRARLIAKGKIWNEGGYLKANRVDSVIKEAEDFSKTQRDRIKTRWEKEGKQPGNAEETAGKRRGNSRETAGKQPGNIEKHQLNQSSADTKEKIPLTATAIEGRSTLSSKVEDKGASAAETDPWGRVYAYGKDILGKSSGGIVTKLKHALKGNPDKVMAKIEEAGTKENPLEWIAAFLHSSGALGGKANGVTWDDVTALGKTFLPGHEVVYTVRNFEKTFPGRPAKALAIFKEAAALEGRAREFWLNEFLWKHGAEGITVGPMS